MTVSIINVRSDDSVLFRQIDGVFGTSMVLDLQHEDDPNGIFQLLLEAQIRETGTDDWRSSAALGPATRQVRFYDVEVGTEYDFRVRHIYSNGTIGVWTSFWQQYDDDGVPTVQVTSHVVQGNLQLPPDATGLTISQSASGSVLFTPAANFIPLDAFGFEIRYGAVGSTDWDLMTPMVVARSSPFESSAITPGEYTFAVKLMNNATDPHEDPLATPPTPKKVNYSANAFFVDFTVVDPRSIAGIMIGATAPTSISPTVTTLTNWANSGSSDSATILGLVLDPVTGTMTFPISLNAPWLVKIAAQVNLDVSVAGSPANDTNVVLFARGSSLGDVFMSAGYIVDKNKQTVLSIGGELYLSVPSGEVLSLGLGTSTNSGNVGYINSQFELEVIPFI